MKTALILTLWFVSCGFLGIFLATKTFAQNNTQIALSDADRAEYWQSLYELSTSNCQNEKDRTKFNAVMAKLSKKCGVPDGQTSIPLDSNGQPSCPKE